MTTKPEFPPRTAPVRRRDLVVAAACGAFVAVMVGMSFAAVPLYDWFCRATGFGGTTQVAGAAPAAISERRVTVRFDANVGRGLPWRFEPDQTSLDVRLGEVVTAFYRITNQSAREITAQAAYNVTPPTAGGHFSKLECFCFTEQRLAPGETRDMPVVFFVEPALADDPEMRDLNTITLSYTFFPVREPGKVAEVRR
ncbi:cytochrome c oxidase assembly protein [Xanthobacteraceae bacterium Astr-EGSB]|uniref:cytochrome c oxidase assembly protein n=1 Tax=Astrobacterium formosum TaxID=3069710 RepID=UPI0027B28CB8|nr:cytochrome c oxidase assembly protein [Xanthobacteraceae bacterium Astr-EGSB]